MDADLKYYSQYRASAIALIFANAVPLIGALFVGIDTFAIVALYWVENVILGLINVLKMITCSPHPDEIDWSKFGSPARVRAIKVALKQTDFDSTAAYAHHGLKLILVPFFIVHYGLFCAVHGFFVFAIFGHDGFEPSPARLARSFGDLVSDKLLFWAVLALAASHLYSFAVNYIGSGEYRRTFVPLLMMQPYARVIVLHVGIIFGGVVVMEFGSPIGLLVLLIVGKTVLDLTYHLRERRRNAPGDATDAQGVILQESPQR